MKYPGLPVPPLMEMEFFFASNFGCDRIVFFCIYFSGTRLSDRGTGLSVPLSDRGTGDRGVYGHECRRRQLRSYVTNGVARHHAE